MSSEVEHILETTILQVDISKLPETPTYTKILEQVLAIRARLVERLWMLRAGEVKVCDGRMSQVSDVREMIVTVEEILHQIISGETQLDGLRSSGNLLIALQAAINSQVMEIFSLTPQPVSSSYKLTCL